MTAPGEAHADAHVPVTFVTMAVLDKLAAENAAPPISGSFESCCNGCSRT